MHTKRHGKSQATHSVESSYQGYRNPTFFVHTLPQEYVFTQVFWAEEIRVKGWVNSQARRMRETTENFVHT